MIVRPSPPLWQLFLVWRGSIVQTIWPQVLFVLLFAVAVVWANELVPQAIPAIEGAPFTLIGIALSIFLAFRNNASYERWWEGRKLWGQLVHLSRTFARQTQLLSERDAEGIAQRQYLLRLVMAFAHALVPHLRPSADRTRAGSLMLPADLARFEETGSHPTTILGLLSKELVQLRHANRLTDIEFQLLDATVDQVEALLAGCERIRNTPLPFAYTLLLHRTAYLFCFLLPFGFADQMGWATPFVTGLIAYAFFGLDALGNELEEPFGTEANDLPIAAIATTIEINLRTALGETDLPPAPQPKGFSLL